MDQQANADNTNAWIDAHVKHGFEKVEFSSEFCDT
jgi:hypothetical protein